MLLWKYGLHYGFQVIMMLQYLLDLGTLIRTNSDRLQSTPEGDASWLSIQTTPTAPQ